MPVNYKRCEHEFLFLIKVPALLSGVPAAPLTCLTMLSCESIHTLTAVHEGHSTVKAARTIHTAMVPTLVDV